jgi:hypothetical protein
MSISLPQVIIPSSWLTVNFLKSSGSVNFLKWAQVVAFSIIRQQRQE